MKAFICCFILLFGTISMAADKKTVELVPDSDGVQRTTVVGGEYYFDPYHIIVKAGHPVEISFKKTSSWIPHNIVIEAPDAGITVRETMEKDVRKITFTPNKPGRYPIFCDKKLIFLKSHREKGMEGVLEVVE